MNRKPIFAIAGLALMFGAGNALAQDDGEVDATEATIGLMEHLYDNLPPAVTNDIALPDHLISNPDAGEEPTAAETNSEYGINNANTKRWEGRNKGDMASQHGFDMREAAEENRANLGRSDENRPDDLPGPQDPPGPPNGD